LDNNLTLKRVDVCGEKNMNLYESPEDRAFREEVRDFVAANVPEDTRYRVLNFLRVEKHHYVGWQKILHARGWAAPGWPQEHGGTGWTATQRTIFDDECYSGGAPRQMPFGLAMLGPVLMRFGNEEQKARYLPSILTADESWCQGYSEPGAGSDLASLRTRADRDGDYYVVNGQKTWTSYAHFADRIFCLVRTRQDCKPQQGISFLLIDLKTPGITVRPIITLDGGHDVNEVFFDNVRVPIDQLVGEENAGWTIAKFLLGHERTDVAGIGICKRFLRRLKEVASQQTRHRIKLIDDQRFRDRIAILEMELTTLEWSLRRLISDMDAGKSVSEAASILKVRGSDIQQALTTMLTECAGPYARPYLPEALEDGYTGRTAGGAELNALTTLYFDFRKVSIFGGTNEVQRNIIAKLALGN
jgi:alkylation response protein AidB-like acyl-CoA dehydrogenase